MAAPTANRPKPGRRAGQRHASLVPAVSGPRAGRAAPLARLRALRGYAIMCCANVQRNVDNVLSNESATAKSHLTKPRPLV